MRNPSYRKHVSGQACVTIRGKDYLLGPYGSPESRIRYDQLIAEYRASGYVQTPGSRKPTPPGLLLGYLAHSEVYFGNKSKEHNDVKVVISLVNELYPNLLSDEFGPHQFKAVRRAMMDRDWNRVTINKRMQRLMRMFKWAVPERLMSHDTYSVLKLIDPLKNGRCNCREPEPVKPVELAALQAVIGAVSPIVAAMIQLQRLTGARPSEICNLRPMDIDDRMRSGKQRYVITRRRITASREHCS